MSFCANWIACNLCIQPAGDSSRCHVARGCWAMNRWQQSFMRCQQHIAAQIALMSMLCNVLEEIWPLLMHCKLRRTSNCSGLCRACGPDLHSDDCEAVVTASSSSWPGMMQTVDLQKSHFLRLQIGDCAQNTWSLPLHVPIDGSTVCSTCYFELLQFIT